MKRQILHTLLPMLVVLMTACQSRPKDVRQVDELPAIWSDYTAVTVPATIAPLNFAMADDAVENIDVTVKGSKGGEMHVNGSYADFDIDAWHELLAANKGGAMTVTVCTEKDGRWTQYRDFQIFISADETGKSVTWPRPSYDGRYIMYTQTEYGYFSVWHPEADLWLLDLKTGERRAMDEVNSPRAESLHNWTPNSRWFFFTSRRDDGLYTRIYLASLDAHGKATKPFLLPQRNPKEYYRMSLYSFNTPDFASRRIEPHSHEVARQIESDKRVH